jgi:uncharacterized membrane protein YbhN (UPF0104 family)
MRLVGELKICRMAIVEPVVSAPRRAHPSRILIAALLIIVIGATAALFGWDIGRWFRHIWDTITSIPVGYLLAALALITIQTCTTAFAWYAILRAAYGAANVSWIQILGCYAAAVALNSIVPANLGTLAMLVMFTTIIVPATFAGVLGGELVQKIFYSVLGTATYVYLFVSVRGSFSLQFGFVSEHPVAFCVLLAGAALLLVLVGRVMRPRVSRWWQEAKDGGQILTHPRRYLAQVAFPEAISWVAMLGIIAVFLSAYKIPVTFDTLMRVVAGNSVANMTAVTPGGAGVQQGFNVLSLKGVTSPANATTYSVAQQLVTTAWNILLAIVLLVRAFGWSGGRTLVQESYGEARKKRAEQTSARKERRRARSAARHGRAVPDRGAALPDDADT